MALLVSEARSSSSKIMRITRGLMMDFSPSLRAYEAIKARREMHDDLDAVGKCIVADDQETALLVMNGNNTRMLLATVLAMLSLRAKRDGEAVDVVDQHLQSLEVYVDKLAYYDGIKSPDGGQHIAAMEYLIKATDAIKQVFAELQFDRIVQVYLGGFKPFLDKLDFALFELRTGIRIEIIK
jgi:hypothetical protein